MTERTPSETIWTFFDALNERDVETATSLIVPSYRGRDVTRTARTTGRDQAREDIQAGLTAFSELSFSIQGCVADAPHVSVRWRMDGRHEGSFLHVPATDQDVSVEGVTFFTVQGGQISHAVHLWDLAGFLRAAGLLPDLPDRDGSSSLYGGDTGAE